MSLQIIKKLKCLLSVLFVLSLSTWVGIGFCKADLITKIPRTSYSISSNSSHNFTSTDITCYMHNLSNSSTTSYDIGTGKVVMTQATLYCFTGTVTIYNDRSSSTSIYYYSGINNYFSGYFSGQCPTCPTIDQNYCTINNLCPSCPTCDDPYTSMECQQEYNLIPISSVDANYCSSNNLCSSSGDGECPELTGDSNWSALYINNVLHDSRPIVRVDIPSEIDRDYSTTPNEFDLNISGYNVDTEWMDGVLSVQNYKPTTNDFSALVGEALPKFGGLLAVCLFVILVFYMIKKIF